MLTSWISRFEMDPNVLESHLPSVKAPQPRLFVVYGDGEAGESVSTQETHDIP